MLCNTFYLSVMAKEKQKFRFPIKFKTIVLIFVLALVVIETAVAYHAVMVSRENLKTYKTIAKDISNSVAEVTNVDDFKELKGKVKTIVDASETKPIAEDSSDEVLEPYLAQFNEIQNDPVFIRTRDYIRKISKANEEFVDCVYYVYIDVTNEIFVYLVDSAEEDACPPGCIDPIYEVNKGLLTDPTIGFPPYVTNTDRYGWLITAGAPVYDGEEVIGYAMADVSMYTVRQKQASSITRMSIYMLITLVLIGVGGVLWVSLWMIRPLKKLTSVAKSYDSGNPKETHDNFQNLKINTRDEISDLTDSLKKMENDVYERYNDLLEVNRQLLASREETKQMQALANQDGLTGVKNKISYNAECARINEIINNGEKTNFAVVMADLNYLKDTNDTYGHDTGDIALIKLSEMICETFKFSPVYRIGGDEFVVISRGKDYQKVPKLVDELKRKILKSIKNSEIHDGEHVSAAVGYSIFDPKVDKNVDDVFKRADKEMYINKHDIKKREHKE